MTERSNWTGVALGLAIACYAAFQQFKMPPALPLMLDAYGYDSRLAGGFMSAYAVAGLLLSLLLGRTIAQRGAGLPVAAALVLMTLGLLVTLAVPDSGATVLGARLFEGVAFTVLAIAGPVLANANASQRALPLVVAATAAWIPVGQLMAIGAAGPAFRLSGWPGLWFLGLLLTAALAALASGGLAARPGGAGRGPAGRRPAGRRRRPAEPGAGRIDDGHRRRVPAVVDAVFAYMTWLPQYLVDLGLSVDGALLGYALPVAIMLPSILMTGRLVQRGVPIGRLLVIGLALQAATWGLLPLAGDGVWGVGTLVLYGIGAGIVPDLPVRRAQPDRRPGAGERARLRDHDDRAQHRRADGPDPARPGVRTRRRLDLGRADPGHGHRGRPSARSVAQRTPGPGGGRLTHALLRHPDHRPPPLGGESVCVPTFPYAMEKGGARLKSALRGSRGG
ncbi:MAG: MFS transporter [Rhodovibrio sp.]|nr:MFS transporter [Rhodovibrio sp.]